MTQRILTWDKPEAIAAALTDAGLDYDPLTIDSDDLRSLILGLEGFADTLDPPDERVLEDIQGALRRHEAMLEGADDDGAHHGWV